MAESKLTPMTSIAMTRSEKDGPSRMRTSVMAIATPNNINEIVKIV